MSQFLLKATKSFHEQKWLNVVWAFITLGIASNTFLEIQSLADVTAWIWFLLHCLVALLFLIRKPVIQCSATVLGLVIPLISVNFYLFYDFSVIQNNALLFTGGQGIIVIASLLCLFSTVALGRCFGVLPAYRGIKTHGAYRWVRHPIYFSYLILDSGILFSYFTLNNFIIFVCTFLLFMLRIRYEEDLLQNSKDYQAYQQKVRFKLIRGIY